MNHQATKQDKPAALGASLLSGSMNGVLTSGSNQVMMAAFVPI